MPRFARVVVPGCPHHLTHRGNRRDEVFFCDEDRAEYLEILLDYTQQYGVDIWGYCLMSNHVHLVGVPEREESLGLAIGRANTYTGWPTGAPEFITRLEAQLGRRLTRQSAGRKPKLGVNI